MFERDVIRVSAPEQNPVDHIMSAPIFDKDKIAILGGTKLFGVKGNGAG